MPPNAELVEDIFQMFFSHSPPHTPSPFLKRVYIVDVTDPGPAVPLVCARGCRCAHTHPLCVLDEAAAFPGEHGVGAGNSFGQVK